MSSKGFLVASLIHPSVDLSSLLFDKYLPSEQVTVIPHDQVQDEQRVFVDGVFIYGKHLPINAEFMDLFPNLRVISCTSSGTDFVDANEATKRGIKIGHTKIEVWETTADLAFALLLASARKVLVEDAMYRSPSFQQMNLNCFGQNVFGSTLGIIGLGGIGAAVARRSKGFGMKTLYYNRKRKENVENEIGIEYCQSLTDLLKQADFVVICISLTPQTQHMIGTSELSCMKETATLINVSRGAIINQDDLVAALMNKEIHAAALDVTTPEPLPRDHPLYTLPNVIITPHIGTSTKACRQSMIVKSLQNLMAGLKGEPLPSSVN